MIPEAQQTLGENHFFCVWDVEITEKMRKTYRFHKIDALSGQTGLSCCWPRIDPIANARLSHLQNDNNRAQTMIYEESDWISEISTTGSTQHRRQHHFSVRGKSPGSGRICGLQHFLRPWHFSRSNESLTQKNACASGLMEAIQQATLCPRDASIRSKNWGELTCAEKRQKLRAPHK